VKPDVDIVLEEPPALTIAQEIALSDAIMLSPPIRSSRTSTRDNFHCGSSMATEIASRKSVANITNVPVPIAEVRPNCGPPIELSHITATNHATPLNATSTACNPIVRR